MVTFFVTGDNHIGRKYDRYPEIKEKLIKSRFDCLQDMVRKAEDEGADFFAVTGDLFDNINTVKVGDVKKVAEILAGFDGRVLVLPGNHDYYTGEDKVWRDFDNALSALNHNITILKEFKEYTFSDVRGKKVVIYPAFCQAKHSADNNLLWIKNADIETDDVINVGIAHGAIKGVTPDIKEEYFLMTENELEKIPVDVWLVGHTHIAYPGDLDTHEDITAYRIFNAGTHEQTDLHNNTEGDSFIIGIEKDGDRAVVYARKFISGKIRYFDIMVNVKPDSDSALRNAVAKAVKEYGDNSVVRINVSGTVGQDEYNNRKIIYDEILDRFLTYEVRDSELSEEITVEKIRSEFAETSFAAQFMEELMGDSTEVRMAYELLQKCKE